MRIAPGFSSLFVAMDTDPWRQRGSDDCSFLTLNSNDFINKVVTITQNMTHNNPIDFLLYTATFTDIYYLDSVSG